jgi:hypothetical protein
MVSTVAKERNADVGLQLQLQKARITVRAREWRFASRSIVFRVCDLSFSGSSEDTTTTTTTTTTRRFDKKRTGEDIQTTDHDEALRIDSEEAGRRRICRVIDQSSAPSRS